MHAIRIETDRALRWTELPDPTIDSEDGVLLRMEHCALNRLDLFSQSGMAFARQPLPIIAGAEGAGVVAEVGSGVTTVEVGDRVVVYPGLVCGSCDRCRSGRENLCRDPAGIMGFHTDGLAAEQVVVSASRLLPIAAELGFDQATCAPITVATVEHMLRDNARLEGDETILVQAGGSGIGTVAIQLAKHLGARVITTVGSEEKAEKARALGADEVILYRTESVPRAVRKWTAKQGVDVVFEHVGAQTWEGSLLSMAKGGRLVICGSHSGTSAKTNLIHLFNQQIKILASFGASKRNVLDSLERLRRGEIVVPIDVELPLERFQEGLEKLDRREVFGKVLYRCRPGDG